MSKTIKKIIFVTLLVILIGLIGFGLWSFQNKESGTGEGISIRDFLPFGEAPETSIETPTPTSTPESNQPISESGELPKLRKISEKPMAGALAFKNDSDLKIRFVDKATGHVFEANTEDVNLERLTNTTLPKIEEAIWAGGNSVILRYLKEDGETIESISLRLIPPAEKSKPFEFKKNLKEGDVSIDVLNLQRTLNRDSETLIAETGPGSKGNETNRFGPKTTDAVKKFQVKYSDEVLKPQNLETPSGIVDDSTRGKLNEITGANVEQSQEEENLYQTALTFLPENIKDIAFITTLQKIFYLEEDSLGTVGTLADSSNQKKTQIFESGATEWTVHKNRRDIIISTKASSNSLGFVYSLSSSGTMKKLLGGLPGFTANVSPLKEEIIYSESAGKGLYLNLYDAVENKSFKFKHPSLPEKCVWSGTEIIYCAVPREITSGDYPDVWYQGEVSFEDDIWAFNAKTMEETLIQKLDTTDGVQLFLSEDEQYLFFTNKKDSQLWSLRLVERSTGSLSTSVDGL